MSIIQREPSLDTHAVYLKYIQSGYTESQATAAVEILKIEFDKLSTKSDIEILTNSMNYKIDEMHSKMDEMKKIILDRIDYKYDLLASKYDLLDSKIDSKYDLLDSKIGNLKWFITIFSTICAAPVISFVVMQWVK